MRLPCCCVLGRSSSSRCPPRSNTTEKRFIHSGPPSPALARCQPFLLLHLHHPPPQRAGACVAAAALNHAKLWRICCCIPYYDRPRRPPSAKLHLHRVQGVCGCLADASVMQPAAAQSEARMNAAPAVVTVRLLGYFCIHDRRTRRRWR